MLKSERKRTHRIRWAIDTLSSRAFGFTRSNDAFRSYSLAFLYVVPSQQDG